MKKNILIISLLLVVFLLTGCSKEYVGKDAKKFKEDYESLNGVTIKDDMKHRSITIDEKNPFEYKTFEEIYEMITNKESFVVYVGFSACPWCRSVIPYVLEVAKENKIGPIYYVNVRSDNTKATDVRGYYKLGEKDKVEVDVPGDEYYYKVLSTLDEYLTPYTLKNSKGKEIKTGENRLYAPTFIVYKDGKAIGLDECISESQTDGFMDLTDEIIKDVKDKAETLFKKVEK